MNSNLGADIDMVGKGCREVLWERFEHKSEEDE
jgi:hypothetical protein